MTKFPLLVNSFQGRDNFGKYLTSLGFNKGEAAVELGTHEAVFANTLLSTWEGKLSCVDPYCMNYDTEEVREMKGSRYKHHETAVETLKPHGGRVELLLLSSKEAVHLFSNETLCFVYVDACHQYRDTKEDLEMWWPKIKSGGLLAGHDIVSCDENKTVGWGRYVQRAVFAFASQHDLLVYLVTGPDTLPWSYYLVKP